MTQPDRLWASIESGIATLGITRVNDVTGLDHVGIPVWQAVRPMSRTLSVSQGKGLTPSAARASAVMESVEMAAAERAVPPAFQFETAFRLGREDWSFMYRGPSTDAEEVVLRSVELQSLCGGRPLAWPVEAVRLDFTVHGRWTDFPVFSTSNGLASSDDRERALLHALQELVERDVAYGGASASQHPGHPVGPGLSPDVDFVLERLDAAALSLRARRLGRRGGLTVVYAEIRGGVGDTVYSGTAARTNEVGALLAAALEAVQSRLTAIAASRDDVTVAKLHVQGRHRPRDPMSVPAYRLAPDDLRGEESAQMVIDALDQEGVQTYVWDFAVPELPVHVVRVVAPGLVFDPDATN